MAMLRAHLEEIFCSDELEQRKRSIATCYSSKVIRPNEPIKPEDYAHTTPSVGV